MAGGSVVPAQLHRQMPEPAETHTRVPLGRPVQCQPRMACDQSADGDARLQSRDVQARAGVCSVTEGQLRVRSTADVEAVGILEDLGVAVGRTHGQGHEAASLDRLPAW